MKLPQVAQSGFPAQEAWVRICALLLTLTSLTVAMQFLEEVVPSDGSTPEKALRYMGVYFCSTR